MVMPILRSLRIPPTGHPTMTKRMLGWFVCAVVALTLPAAAEAQGAANPEAAKLTAFMKAGSRLEITDELLADFVAGLTRRVS